MRLAHRQRITRAALISLICVSILPAKALAAPAPLSAEQSDPRTLGWMQGFPPAPEQRITQPDSNFFSFPKLRWSVCHMRELLPTAAIPRAIAHYSALPEALNPAIDELQFTPTGADQPISWRDGLAANYTDGMLVLHRGKVVYENYQGCLGPQQHHAAMSMTKSVTGLLAEMLIARGQLDENALVGTLIPALQGSAFANATVRQVMDMTTALKYSEDYADPNADIWQYSAAANPLPKPAGYQGPVGYYEYLMTVPAAGEHGKVFGYKTVNSDVLGWVLATVSGKPYNQLVSELLWQPLGMQQDAYVTVDGLGTPFAGGGISATLRDLGRLGQALLDAALGKPGAIAPELVHGIQAGGDKAAFAAGFSSLAGGSYRSMWWVFHNPHRAFAARGVHGQTIYIDPTAEMVIVRFASHPVASNSANDATSLPAYQALAEFLLKQKPD